MKIHPTTVEGFDGTLAELARRLALLRYDKLVEFLQYFEAEIARQAEADEKIGRVKLARLLLMAGSKIGFSADDFTAIFKLCQPYMAKELTANNDSEEKTPAGGSKNESDSGTSSVLGF